MTGQFIPYIGSDPYTVEIEGAGGNTVEIISCKVFSESEVRDPMSVMNPQRAEVVIKIEDAGQESFIEELGSSVKERFVLRIKYQGFDLFAGIVTHDFIQWDDAPFPYGFTINAIDGITRLRDIDYVDENGDPFENPDQDNYITAADHIKNCFEKIGMSEMYSNSLFGANRIFLKNNWYATNMQNQGQDSLGQTFISRDVFYSVDQEGNLIAKKCYDVFKAILEGFGMRLMYGRGFYLIEQLSERDTGANTYDIYDFSMNYQGQLPILLNEELKSGCGDDSPGELAAFTAANGKFAMMPPLKQVKVLYDYSVFEVADEPDILTGFSGTGPAEICPGPNGFGLVSTLSVEPDEFKFRVNFQLKHSSTYTGVDANYIPHRLLFSVKLSVVARDENGTLIDEFRFVRRVHQFDPITEEEEWIPRPYTAPNDTYNFVSGLVSLDYAKNSGSNYADLGFETLVYPVTDAHTFEIYICVGLQSILFNGGPVGSLGPEYQHAWTFSDVQVITSDNNDKAKPKNKTEEYTSAINDGGKDSHEINLLFNDIGNTLKVEKGGALVNPGGWGVGGGGDKHLGQLLAEEYHKVRGRPIRLMQRMIIGRNNVYCDNLIQWEYANNFFLSMVTSHDYYKQEITGTWWSIGNFSTPEGAELVRNTVRKDYNRLDDREPLSGLPARSFSRGIDGDGFTAPAVEYVFNDGDLPDKTEHEEYFIRKKLFVHVNGNKLLYVEADPIGPRQHSINNTNNSITVDPNFPLSERHEIQVLMDHGF